MNGLQSLLMRGSEFSGTGNYYYRGSGDPASYRHDDVLDVDPTDIGDIYSFRPTLYVSL